MATEWGRVQEDWRALRWRKGSRRNLKLFGGKHAQAPSPGSNTVLCYCLREVGHNGKGAPNTVVEPLQRITEDSGHDNKPLWFCRRYTARSRRSQGGRRNVCKQRRVSWGISLTKNHKLRGSWKTSIDSDPFQGPLVHSARFSTARRHARIVGNAEARSLGLPLMIRLTYSTTSLSLFQDEWQSLCPFASGPFRPHQSTALLSWQIYLHASRTGASFCSGNGWHAHLPAQRRVLARPTAGGERQAPER